MNFQFNNNTIVITPNQRLTQFLHQQHDQEMIKRKFSSWTKPKILPFASWLETLWNNSPDPRILLSREQETILWHTLLAENTDGQLGAKVQEAWELTHQWQLDPSSWLNQASAPEIKLYLSWHRKFYELCEENTWISPAQLPEQLIKSHQQTHFPLPKKIVLFGFEEINPQTKCFLNYLTKQQVEVEYVLRKNQQGICRRISFSSLEQELLAMAKWCQQQLKQNPDAQVGCVVPNLTKMRKEIKRTFSKVFNEESAFNISAGEALSTLPMIRIALDILSLQEPFSFRTLSQLLLSPFLSASHLEFSTNATIEAQLRDLDQTSFTLEEISNFCNSNNQPSRLAKLATIVIHNNSCHTAATWVQIFLTKLTLSGWPKNNQLSSREQQIMVRWQKLLQQFSTLDLLGKQLPFATAVAYLRNLAQKNLFQIQTEPKSINILGYLEASGMNFDYLWVMGMDNQNWPQTAKPNPFIPFLVQKHLQIPHASAQRELSYCEAITTHFKASAHEIIFSYLNQIDEHKCNPSPLITDLPEITLSDLKIPATAALQLKPHHLETITDDFGPEITMHTKIKGGSKIFELQSLCPFRAFAELRLQATALATPTFGISKKTRGIILHQALEQIWQQLKTQHRLIAMADPELKAVIAKALEKSLHLIDHNLKFRELEKTNLIELLWQSLLLEKTRPTFAVLATESNLELCISNMKISLRIDRMDELADKSILIIDYKTGKNLPIIGDWLGDRPKNLQLPLYAIATEGKQHIAFAQIHPDAIKFIPITLEKINAQNHDSNLNLTWESLIITWRIYLEKLATDFKQGKADVDPIDSKTCELCKLQPLCRISSSVNSDYPRFCSWNRSESD